MLQRMPQLPFVVSASICFRKRRLLSTVANVVFFDPIIGHLFCHKCILDTFRFNEERRALEGAGKASRGNCPVCRKVISKIDVTGPRRSLVPLQLKLTTKKRS